MTNQAYNLGFLNIGKDVVVWPHAQIVFPEKISLGDSVMIDSFVLFLGAPGTTIGSFVHIGAFTSIGGGGEFVMEDFSGLSGGIRVYTGNEDYSGGSLTNPTVPYPFRVPTRSYVRIKKHAIIGANSVVLPGVTIGEGASVGANSLVKSDCEPWTIYAGSPARPMKPRKRGEMLDLEKRLKATFYDSKGKYISKDQHLNR
jgi:acetyltransferase-like isoleucine patch superfamily enzyme